MKRKLHIKLSLRDLRAGHYPGTKTPPWWLNEMWEVSNPEWRKAVEQMNWKGANELLVGTGIIDGEDVDIFARRDSRQGPDYFGFVVYPKGKKYADFWS